MRHRVWSVALVFTLAFGGCSSDEHHGNHGENNAGETNSNQGSSNQDPGDEYGALVVTVFNDAMMPFEGATVVVTGNEFVDEGTTDGQGEVRFANLDVGAYDVEASAPDHDPAVSEQVEVTAGETATVELQFYLGQEPVEDGAPEFLSDPVESVAVGELYVYQVEVQGDPDPVISAESAGGGELPGWLDFDDEQGVLTGVPAESDVGSVDIALRSANEVAPDAQQDFTIAVSSGETTVESRGELSQFGITWSFDDDYDTGQFANGDYWVVGPVEIVAIDPASVEDSEGRIQHGAMINPSATQGEQDAGGTHGYDSAADRTTYEHELNVAFDVSAENPLIVEPGSSLISTTTHDDLSDAPLLRDAAVLTVVDTAPTDGSFRPPYIGDEKSIDHHVSQFDTAVFADLEPVNETPDPDAIAERFERPWIDQIRGWRTQTFAPSNNMPNYGREMATDIGVAALLLNLDFTDEELETLLIRLVQLGIDNYGIAADGATDHWHADGGHNQGRKLPILLAGVVLDDENMMAIGDTDIQFGEDEQTFYVTEDYVGLGQPPYTEEDIGMAEWRFRDQEDAYHNAWNVDSYRRCCTANSFVGNVLAARIMGLKALWNHDPLFDYQDRYMDNEDPGTWQRSWDRPFTESMWDSYREEF